MNILKRYKKSTIALGTIGIIFILGGIGWLILGIHLQNETLISWTSLVTVCMGIVLLVFASFNEV
jgi:hypothetical protein